MPDKPCHLERYGSSTATKRFGHKLVIAKGFDEKLFKLCIRRRQIEGWCWKQDNTTRRSNRHSNPSKYKLN